ncbi:MAG: DUF2207 domain-containing protein, partial [Candidatus Cloacimonetes bacterium]|nr:DUF2207 domain-containing protein [Candidatus Cloacimonadota bacterium]
MKKAFLIFLSLISFCFVARPVLAKDYSFPKVSVDIQINADGSFNYVENRIYDFEGFFSWA